MKWMSDVENKWKAKRSRTEEKMQNERGETFNTVAVNIQWQ